MPAAISIVIPTLAESRRASSILEAIDSVLTQGGVTAVPIVVINGNHYDTGLRRNLEQSKHLTTFYQEDGDLPRAIAAGRRVVGTEFFAFLDDDDKLLPDSLAQRVEILSSDPSLDCLVSNGYRYRAVESALYIPNEGRLREIRNDPLRAMFFGNWLASCGGTYRTATIPADFFDDTVKYYEWTYFAFRLALAKRLAFEPGRRFLINDSPDSLSKVGVARLSELLLWEKLCPLLKRRSDLTGLARARTSRAHHDVSEYYRAQKDPQLAWKHHWRSLTSCPTYGWRYLPYTRHMLGALRANVELKPHR